MREAGEMERRLFGVFNRETEVIVRTSYDVRFLRSVAEHMTRAFGERGQSFYVRPVGGGRP